jgi:hypothetical protein
VAGGERLMGIPDVNRRVVGDFFFVGRIEKIEGYDCGNHRAVRRLPPCWKEVQQSTTAVTLLVIV